MTLETWALEQAPYHNPYVAELIGMPCVSLELRFEEDADKVEQKMYPQVAI
jgi:hypothetical protein